jgi:serine/threonine-protein kinase
MATQNKSRVPAGTVVGSKFRITKEIGRGGMAAVYEAENIDIGKRVAVKILAAELITSKVVRERFLREARAAAAIRSPYICDVYDSGVYEERPFLVMELLEGESLYDRLTRARRLDPDTTLTISTHSARGLSQAHDANVIHRDLKPENIFITTTPEGHMLGKILDFGLAKFYEPTDGTAENVRLTREGALFGTPAYMSPEQAKGQGGVDHRADLWALGCIVYECLTGQTVWNVDQGVAMILAQIAGAPIPRPSRLRPDLPKTFDPWFLKALDRDPNRRFQTAKEFADTLADALRPLPEVERAHSLHSEAEGVVLDQLISDPGASLGAMASPPVQHIPTPPVAEIPTWRPGSRSSGRAIAVLLLFAALGLGAYAIWLYVLHPPGTQTAASGSGISTSGTPAASSGSAKLEPREAEAYALQIAAAQQALRDGKAKDAVSLFKEAFNNGGSNVARALASHSTVALETSEGKCKVTGLGRPRPFALVIDSSRPTIAATSAGLVAAWVDNHEDSRKKQGFSALLDGALRRVNEPLLVTPEASSVRHPQLAQLNDKIALLYWEDANNEPGVYVRRLDAEGRIAGPARRVSETKRDQFYPALAAAGDAGFWAVWSEEHEPGVEDLVGRRLGKEFEPIGPPVRLTRHVTTPGVKVSASKPDVAVAHGTLFVVFALETATETRPMLLRVKLDDPELSSAPGDPALDKKRKRNKGDWTVGTTKPLAPAAKGKNAQPRIACSTEGCFAAWDDENAGANLAFIDKDRGEAIWHREISRRGARPAVAVSGSSAAVAWYESSRVKIALISRDTLGEPSVLARVSGHQPYPAITPGLEPGQWYISWRDYEAGHLEAFVVRAGCQ